MMKNKVTVRSFMKLSFIVILSLMMVISMAGCSTTMEEQKQGAEGQNSSVTKSEETEKSEESSVAAEKAEKIELRLVTISTDENRVAIMEDYIKPNIEAAFPNVIVEFEPGGGGGDLANKLKTYNAAGDLPDVWYSDASYATPIIAAGNQLDLTEYIVADGFIEKYAVPGALKFKDGKIYTLGSGADTYFTPRIFYNKKIFADNNLEIPRTFDELLEVVEKLKANDIIPVTTMGKGGWAPSLYLFQTMVTIEDPSVMEDLVNNKTDFSNPVVYNALDRIDQLAEAGAFPEGISGLDYGPAKELFTSDKAAMYWMFSWEVPSLAENPNYGFFPWPSAGEAFDGNNAIQYWGSPLNGYAVNANSEHIEEAVALAEFCAMQDALYFASQNTPLTLETGIELSDVPELMETHLNHYNGAEQKIASFKLNSMDAKVDAEFASLGAFLLTGDYSAEEFIEDFNEIWEENTWFD